MSYVELREKANTDLDPAVSSVMVGGLDPCVMTLCVGGNAPRICELADMRPHSALIK